MPSVKPPHSPLLHLPPLVFAEEIRLLKSQLAKVARQEAFLLQGGDSTVEGSLHQTKSEKERLRVLLQMAAVLTYASLKPVVKVGKNPSPEPTLAEDQALLASYHHAAAKHNISRAFTQGGFADLAMVQRWNRELVKKSQWGSQYEHIAHEITQAIAFMDACGIQTKTQPQLHQADLFTSHRARHDSYERGLIRVDSEYDQKTYATSAHLLWLEPEEQTPNSELLAFCQSIHNPIGLSIGPTTTSEQLLTLLARLNPDNELGKVVLITRFGKDLIQQHFPPLLDAVIQAKRPVVWCCDPMFANTTPTKTGRPTRGFDDVLEELAYFFALMGDQDAYPGGVHFDLTGDDVIECMGGPESLGEHDLTKTENPIQVPRLNAPQSLAMAFRIAENLGNRCF